METEAKSTPRREVNRRASAARCAILLGAALGAFGLPGGPVVAGVTTSVTSRNAYAQPLPGLSREHRREFSIGNSFFNDNWVLAPASTSARDGLGPFFHARSCSGCHPFDGRGRPPAEDELMIGLVFRLGTADDESIPVYGHQLAPRAVPGLKAEGDVGITWRTVERPFSDGSTHTLIAPEFAPQGWNYGPPPSGLRLSPRLAMPVIGGGLLETIPAEQILARADPEDHDGDGISGRPHFVPADDDSATATRVPGRFGWKARVPSLRRQIITALADDIGITSRGRPQQPVSPEQADAANEFPDGAGAGEFEAEDKVIDLIVTYLRALAPPARRDRDDPEVRAGEVQFSSLRCARCHVPESTTAATAPLPELAGQTIHPFTDLLLHDMGPELADGRPDGEAGGSEWRTPPLWGLGLLETVNGHTRLLHDGRARDIEEAILWHGGEAAPSRDAYRALPHADRASLIRFLQSL